MKQETRFEKVVEWEKEPDWMYLITLPIIFFCYVPLMLIKISKPLNTSLYNLLGVRGLIFLFIGAGVLTRIFCNAIGHGRKVYWRKIQ